MQLVQFAVPERLGALCAEVATVIAGGATLLNALGWWVDGKGEVQREAVSWLVVGADDDKVDEVVDAVKAILKGGGESAVFYVIGSEPKLEWL
jgi:hypothetical protein